MSIIGTRVLRNEDPQFLTRGAVYTDDVVDERLAGALHVTFVRSQLAHARITGIDPGAALEAPGVVAVITAADMQGVPLQEPMPGMSAAMTQSLLADGTVRFVGEPVAVVVTEERYQGEDAAALVFVDYEPLPVVVDAREAARDSVLLFPEAGTNVAMAHDWDAEQASDLFEGCDVVVSREIINQRVAPAPLEVRAASAVVTDDGRITTWISNQGAQNTRAGVAGGLGVDPSQVRVITPDVGGGFGAKVGADPEHIVVAWLARHLGRPVRWVETRWENLVGMTHGRGQVQTVTIGGRRDGRVLAYRLEILQDCGAYPRFGAFLPFLTRMMAPGVYDIAKVETRGRSVVTNTTPVSAYRGAGRPEATAAIERAMDLFAAEIGMDPVEVRRINLLPPFDAPKPSATGAPYDCGDYGAALDLVLAAAGYDALRAEQASRRRQGDVVQLGIGVSVYVEITGPPMEAGAPRENATIEVHPDGSATILTGTSP
ncbi:MAG TPA: xanthine dehydrogenase family protein, partial [Streptosporangiaceae bacterium]|nr:xanthine dehydrogenase family protein [Streptosporangiaceae bacterium]